MIKGIPQKTLLYIVVGACVGLIVLDNFIIEPAIHAWGEQGDRIEELQKKVARGRSLLERETIIRARWAEMLRANLPNDDSVAGDNIINAISRWQAASRIGLPSLTPPQAATHDDLGADKFEYRAVVTGDQVSLGQFIYALETDPIPVNLEDCEFTERDKHGQQLTLTARFSFARLTPESATRAASASIGGNAAGRPAR